MLIEYAVIEIKLDNYCTLTVYHPSIQLIKQVAKIDLMKTALRSVSANKNNRKEVATGGASINICQQQVLSHNASGTNPFNESFEAVRAGDKTTGDDETECMVSTPFAKSLAYVTAKQSNDGNEQGYRQQAHFKSSEERRALVDEDEDGVHDQGNIEIISESQLTTGSAKPQMVVAIKDLTQRILQLQKKSHSLFKSGHNLQCPAIVDQIVKIRISIEGPSSESLIDYITQVGRLFNQAALELLSQDEPEDALQMLQATQEILEQVDQRNSKITQLASLTLNNLSNIYKRKGEIQEAHECLKKALKKAKFAKNTETQSNQQKDANGNQHFEDRSEEASESQQLEIMIQENQPLFHMNICALFSQQGNHEKAKTHAGIAVKDLEQSILKIKQQIQEAEIADLTEQKMIITDQSEQENKTKSIREMITVLRNKFKDRIGLLAIAYFNLGCECEHLNLLEECLEAYQRATGLQIGRYGHQTIEAQFHFALNQVQQRLRDHEVGMQYQQRGGVPNKSKHGKSPQRRAKQPPRHQQPNKSKTNMTQTRSDAQDAQIGSRLEKTFEAILHMNRIDGAPKSFELSQKNALSQRPVSQQNQTSQKKQWLGSNSNSSSRLQEITEEKNIEVAKYNSQLQQYNSLLLDCQHITPVKPSMARTGNGFAPGGKPIEPYQPNRRVMSSSTQKRPQSAQNIQEDLFESNLSKQQRQAPNQLSKSIQLAVSGNQKATKCLKQANWTKKWFQNAYISVNASSKLQDALAFASESEGKMADNLNRAHSVEQDSNSQNSRNVLSRNAFSSNQKPEHPREQADLPASTFAKQQPQQQPSSELHSAQVVSEHTQSLINLRPTQMLAQGAQFSKSAARGPKIIVTAKDDKKQSSKRSHSQQYQRGGHHQQNAWINQQVGGEPGSGVEFMSEEQRKEMLLKEYMHRYVYAVPPGAGRVDQLASKTRTASAKRKHHNKASSPLKRKLQVRRGGSGGSQTTFSNNLISCDNIAYLPQITGQPMQNQMMMARSMSVSAPASDEKHRAKIRAAFSSKTPTKNVIIEKLINNKLARSNSHEETSQPQPVTRNVVYTVNAAGKPPMSFMNLNQKGQSQLAQTRTVLMPTPMSKKQRERARLQSEMNFATTSQQLKNIDFFRMNKNAANSPPLEGSPEAVRLLMNATGQLPQGMSNTVIGKSKFASMGASRGHSEQKRGGGQGRQKQSSQAKMLKQQRAQNANELLYTGQIEAAERYTQGPIVQVIQPLDGGERKLLVTQTINLKNKKPEVLIKQLMQGSKRSSSHGKKQAQLQQQLQQSAFHVNYQQVKSGLSPVKPPKIVSQPAIMFIPNQQGKNLAVRPTSPSLFDAGSESKFTKGVRQKVIRQTHKIIDDMTTTVDEAIHHLSTNSEPAEDEGAEFERVPVTISEEPIADEEEVAGGSYIVQTSMNNLEVTQEHYEAGIKEQELDSSALTKASLVIQSYFRGQQARQIVHLIKQQQASKDDDDEEDCKENEENTLELDDDYKDDAFDSADGKTEEIHSLEEIANRNSREEFSIRTEQPQVTSAHIESDKNIASLMIEEESIIEDFNKNLSKSLVLQESTIKSQRLSEQLQQQLTGEILRQQVRTLLQATYKQAIDLAQKEEEDRRKLIALQKRKTADGATQTSMRQASAREVSIQATVKIDESVEPAAVENSRELNAESEEQEPAMAVPVQAETIVVTRKPQEVAQSAIQDADVPFVSIDDAEVIVKERTDLPCNHKVQVVLLPFKRDLGGVKLAFKAINLADPTFQNELIHIDLNLSAEKLLSNQDEVDSLIGQLEVNEKNGNLSLPQDDQQEIALFTMFVASESEEDKALEREVIAIYQRGEQVDSKQGQLVALQTMTEPKNIVTIPLKMSQKKPKLAELKSNLAKHLPRIVFVDVQGNVALSQDERERIGRVLPNGQTTQNISFDRSDTFTSLLDRGNHRSSPPAQVNRSQQTISCQHNNESGFALERTSELGESPVEVQDESSEKSKLLSNFSETIIKETYLERKITQLKPRALILENMITAAKLPTKQLPPQPSEAVIEAYDMTQVAGNGCSALYAKESREASSIQDQLPEKSASAVQESVVRVQKEEEVTVRCDQKEKPKVLIEPDETQLSSIRSFQQLQDQSLNILGLASYESLTQGLHIFKKGHDQSIPATGEQNGKKQQFHLQIPKQRFQEHDMQSPRCHLESCYQESSRSEALASIQEATLASQTVNMAEKDHTSGLHESKDRSVHQSVVFMPALKQVKFAEKVEVLCKTEIFDEVSGDFGSEQYQSSIKEKYVKPPVQRVHKPLADTQRKLLMSRAFESVASEESSIEKIEFQQVAEKLATISMKTKYTEAAPEQHLSMKQESNVSSLHLAEKLKELSIKNDETAFEAQTQYGVLQEGQLGKDYSQKSLGEKQDIMLQPQFTTSLPLRAYQTQSSNIFERADSDVSQPMQYLPLYASPGHKSSQSFSYHQVQMMSDAKDLPNLRQHQFTSGKSLQDSIPEQSTEREQKAQTQINVNRCEVQSLQSQVKVRKTQSTPKKEITEVETQKDLKGESMFKQDSCVSSLKEFQQQIKVATPVREEVLADTRREHEVKPTIEHDFNASSIQVYEESPQVESPQKSLSIQLDKAEIDTQTDRQMMSPFEQHSIQSSLRNLFVVEQPVVTKQASASKRDNFKQLTPRVFRTQTFVQANSSENSSLQVAPVQSVESAALAEPKMIVDNNSNVSSLHEVVNPMQKEQSERNQALSIKESRIITPRQRRTQPLLKHDTFVSSLQEDAPVVKNMIQVQYMEVNSQSQHKVDQETPRDKKVSALLKHDTFVSSMKDVADRVEPVPMLLIPPKKDFDLEIETNRGTEVQNLLKHDTFVSSLKDHQFDPPIPEPKQASEQPEKKLDEGQIETKRSTQVKTLLKHDTNISSLKDDPIMPELKVELPPSSGKKLVENEIPTNRSTEVQQLLKQETFVSDIKDSDSKSHVPKLQLPQKQQRQQCQNEEPLCGDTRRSIEVKALLKHDTFVSSLKEEEKKPESPQAAKQVQYTEFRIQVENEIPTNRGIEVQSLLKHDTFVSSLSYQAEKLVEPEIQAPVDFKKQIVEQECTTQRGTEVNTLLKLDSNVSSLKDIRIRQQKVSPTDQKMRKLSINESTDREIEASASMSEHTESDALSIQNQNKPEHPKVPRIALPSKVEADTQRDPDANKAALIKHDTNVSSLIQSAKSLFEQPVKPSPVPDAETNRAAHKPSSLAQDPDSPLRSNIRVSDKSASAVSEQAAQSLKSLVEPATPLNTRVKASFKHAPVEDVSPVEVIAVPSPLKAEAEQPSSPEVKEAETQRQQVQTLIGQKSDSSGLSKLLPRPQKAPLARPQSATKRKKKTLTSSCTQRSIHLANSMKSESKASAGDLEFWKKMQQAKVKAASKPREIKKKKRPSSKASKTVIAAQKLPSATESISIQSEEIPLQQNPVQRAASSGHHKNNSCANYQNHYDNSLIDDKAISDPQLSYILHESFQQGYEPAQSLQQNLRSEEEEKLVKINPNKIKSVKTKTKKKAAQGLNTGTQLKQLSNHPPTRQAQNSKHMESIDPESEFSEIVQHHRFSPGGDKKRSNEINIMQTSSQSIEMSTVKDVIIDRGIRYLYVQKQLQTKLASPVKRYNTSKNNLGAVGPTVFELQRPSLPNSTNQSQQSSQQPKERHMWNYSAVDREVSVAEESKGTMTINFQHKMGSEESVIVEKEHPKNRPLTPVPETVTKRVNEDAVSATINDWRAGVKIKFEVTGPNQSTIQLLKDDKVIDQKNVAFNLNKISQNYDVNSLQQFCTEWLMPCVSIKDAEWITDLIQDDPKSLLPSLQLQVHGEMLSELIFKQFQIGGTDSRPASAITDLKNEDERDEARMYTQEPSQIESQISKERSTNEKLLNEQVLSDNATTIPAQTAPQIDHQRIRIERSATQQNFATRNQGSGEKVSNLHQHKSEDAAAAPGTTKKNLNGFLNSDSAQ